MDGAEEHTAGGLAHHLSGGQVGDGHQGLAHQLLRLVELGNAGKNLPVGAGTVVQSEAQQLVALLHIFTGLHLHGPEFIFAEGVEIHAFFGVRLDFDGGLGLGQLFQSSQLLLHVDSGEQGRAGNRSHIRRQHAEFIQAVPIHGRTAQTAADFRSGVRHEGGQQACADPHGFQQIIQNPCQPGFVCLLLCQHPGSVLVDILVGTGDDLEDFRQRILEGKLLHLLLISIPKAGGHSQQLGIQFGVLLLPSRQSLAEVFQRHGNRTGHQIAQIVGKIHIDGVDQQLIGEVAVGAKGEGAQQEEPQGIHAEPLRQNVGIHHIALGLAHLAAVQQQPAVTKYLLGQGQVQAHQHGRPDDGVEPDNLLADEVDIRRPEVLQIVVFVVFKAQSRHVVKQGVNPHIHHMAGVEVHRHAPSETGTGYAQILQTGLDEVVHHLGNPAPGLQKIGVFQQILHPVSVLAEPEEVGLLLGLLNLAAAVGALAVHQLSIRPEGLAGLAVFAHILALVDVAVVVHLLEDLLDGLHMVVVGGADEPVIGDVHQLPQIQHAPLPEDDIVHKLLGSDSGGLGLVLDFLTVLVGAGEELYIVALQPLEPGHGIGGHGAVGVADMELCRGIIDGGGNIVITLAFLAHKKSSCKTGRRRKIKRRPGKTQGRQKLTRYHLASREISD